MCENVLMCKRNALLELLPKIAKNFCIDNHLSEKLEKHELNTLMKDYADHHTKMIISNNELETILACIEYSLNQYGGQDIKNIEDYNNLIYDSIYMYYQDTLRLHARQILKCLLLEHFGNFYKSSNFNVITEIDIAINEKDFIILGFDEMIKTIGYKCGIFSS